MQKDVSYHESAIKYNDELEQFAAGLADRLDHPEVQRWSRSVAKQHNFHGGRHRKSLAKLKEEEAARMDENQNDDTTTTEDQPEGIVVTTYDGQSIDEFEKATEDADKKEVDVDYRDAGTGQFVTEEYAAKNQSTTVGEVFDQGDDADDEAEPAETPATFEPIPVPTPANVDATRDTSMDAAPISAGGPDPMLADDPTPAGVETPFLTEAQAQEAFNKAQAEAQAASEEDTNG